MTLKCMVTHMRGHTSEGYLCSIRGRLDLSGFPDLKPCGEEDCEVHLKALETASEGILSVLLHLQHVKNSPPTHTHAHTHTHSGEYVHRRGTHLPTETPVCAHTHHLTVWCLWENKYCTLTQTAFLIAISIYCSHHTNLYKNRGFPAAGSKETCFSLRAADLKETGAFLTHVSLNGAVCVCSLI